MTKYWKGIIIGFISIFFIFFIILQYVFPTPEDFPIDDYTKPILIAHAGSAVNGKTYTNSLEAIEKAAKSKYEFLELDLIVTEDKKIGAAHTIDDFNEFTGFGRNFNPLYSEDFKNRRLFDSLHPLQTEAINSFFEKNNKMILVTDKIDDFDLMNEQLRVDKDRMLVEVFNYKSYAEALRKGIKYPMLCIWHDQGLYSYSKFFTTGKVKMITIPVELIYSSEAKLKELHNKGIQIFAFTSNDKEFILKYGGTAVTGFYTDSITYSDLYAPKELTDLNETN